jgi:starch-binding outer membrane protein, SusD/RagB family
LDKYNNDLKDFFNMKNRFFYIIIGAFLILFSSCQKEVLDQAPQASLDDQVALNNRFGVDAALLGIYDALQSNNYYGTNFTIFGDMAADNLAHVGTFPTFAQVKNRAILTDNVNITNLWDFIYRGVNRANGVIEAAPKIQDPAFNNNRAIAESRFLRALLYFDLVRSFGGVPVVVLPTRSPDPSILNVKRGTEAEVYAQILEDLNFAEQNLPDAQANRATKWAATALKTRVFLYQRNYQGVVSSAAQIAASNRFNLVANYRTIYETKNSAPEAMFEIEYNNVDGNSMAFHNWTTALGGRNEVRPTGAGSTLPTAYEVGDLRRDATIAQAGRIIDGRTITAGLGIKYFRITNGDDNIIVIRYAEVLLNQAEALVELGRMAEAVPLINQIRRRAGLAEITAGTQDEMRLVVERERRLELALEGHRWFDLKRTGRLQAVLGLTNPNAALWPIPFRETTNNPNMTQNPGY